MKRMIPILLCFVLAVPLFSPIGVSAANGDSEYAYYVKSRDKTVVIEGYKGAGGHVTVPATLDGYPVSEIGMNAFENRDDLITLTLPISLTEFSPYACYGCDNLEAIRVPEESTAFTAVDGVLFDKSKTALILCPRTQKGAYTVPKGVTTIGEAAFNNCKGLTAVTMPATVTEIGGVSFSGCTALTSVSLSERLKIIGYLAFANCRKLERITIPDSVTTVACQAFQRCTALKTVKIGKGLTVLGEMMFSDCTALTSFTVPDTVLTIGMSAFSDCTGLKEITIGAGVDRITEYAFSGCTTLQTVRFSASMPTVESNAFDGCTALTDVYYDRLQKPNNIRNNDHLMNATWHLRKIPTGRPTTVTDPSRSTTTARPTEQPIKPTADTAPEKTTVSATRSTESTAAATETVTASTAAPTAADEGTGGPELWVILALIAAVSAVTVLTVTLLRQKRGGK